MMCNKNELGKHGGIKYHETRNRRTSKRREEYLI